MKVGLIVLAFILLAFVSVGSETLSATGDELIRNTNGNQWMPTGANVQLAINDLNDSGTVWIGSDVTLSSTIHMKDSVSLDFQNTRVTLGSNIEFVNFTECEWASVRNAYIIPSTYHNKSIIVIYNDPSSGWSEHCRYNIIENIRIVEPSPYTRQHNWTGIHLKMDGDSDISLNIFRDITMYGCRNGILLESNHAGAYANGNRFDNIWIDRYLNGVWFDDIDGDSFNQNVFTHVKLQTIDGGGSEEEQPTGYTEPMYGFRNISGTGNHFDHCLVWDWHVADAPQYSWWIGPNAAYTKINTHAFGKWSYDSILDEGRATVIEGEEDGIHQVIIEILVKRLTFPTIALIVGSILLLVLLAVFLTRKKLRLK